MASRVQETECRNERDQVALITGVFSTILGVLLLFDAGTVLPAIFGG
jgi:hypothetical protein